MLVETLKFDPSGNLITSFDPATEDRGTDWVSLAPDGWALFYTSEGTSVRRYDVCKDAQLSDFSDSLPNPAYENVPLTGGGMLVADTNTVVRLDASGQIVQTYSTSSDSLYYGLALATDGNSFWAGDYISGHVVHFDLATGSVLGDFYTGTGYAGGIAIR